MTMFLLKELRSNDLRTADICISRFERTQNTQTTDKGGYMQDDAQFPSSIADDQSSALPARSPERDDVDIATVPLTKIITKSMFVLRSRSNHTFESIGSVSIISQSSISPISSFTCRSFNRLNHSYCFIDPFIPQKYEIEKRTKFTKVHKVSDAFYLFNLFIK